MPNVPAAPPAPRRAAQPDFRFDPGLLAEPAAFALSDDGRALTRAGAEGPYLAALASPAVESAGRAYAEFCIDALPPGESRCYLFLGVTALAAPPSGRAAWAELSEDRASRGLYCLTGAAMPGERGHAAPLKKGDRVGLLVGVPPPSPPPHSPSLPALRHRRVCMRADVGARALSRPGEVPRPLALSDSPLPPLAHTLALAPTATDTADRR